MYMLSMIYVPGDRVASKSVPKVQREIEKKVYQKYRGKWKCAQMFKVKQFTVFRINSIRTV